MQYLLANGEHMRIREAVPDDAAALLSMFRKAVQETDFLMTTIAEAEQITEAQERQFVLKYAQNDNNLFLIALSGKKVIASLSVTQSRWAKQKHTGEFGVVVLEAYWNMGIARRLINQMMQWLATHPVLRYIQLSVMANNEKAIRLYQNFGFKEEGRRAGAIYLNARAYGDVILMGQWVKKADQAVT